MKMLYIFDFDGTLVDSLYDSVIAYNGALRKFNQEVYEFERVEDINFEEFISFMGSDEDVLEEYAKIYFRSPKNHTKPYRGIKELLNTLNNNPNVELAICSNRMQELLDLLVPKLFPDIDFKYVVGHIRDEPFKPNPYQLNKIIKNENYSNDEIVYIGDRFKDIETAKNVGIDAIIVKWGQGSSQAYTDNYPLMVVDRPSQILNINKVNS